jgi:hypothetical protein
MSPNCSSLGGGLLSRPVLLPPLPLDHVLPTHQHFRVPRLSPSKKRPTVTNRRTTVTERSNVQLMSSCTNRACAATFLDDYIISKRKVDLDGGCSSVVPSVRPPSPLERRRSYSNAWCAVQQVLPREDELLVRV